jgi:hypothetical protein
MPNSPKQPQTTTSNHKIVIAWEIAVCVAILAVATTCEKARGKILSSPLIDVEKAAYAE